MYVNQRVVLESHVHSLPSFPRSTANSLYHQIESLNPLTTLPIICGGTHYYTQHFLFPPSRLSLDRTSSDSTASKSKNNKWRPRDSLDEVLETLERSEEGRGVVRRIRTEPGVREYLDTFYLPNPTFPPTWIQPSETPPRQSTKPHNLNASSLSDQQLLAQHRLLTLVDEREAGRWHWRDGRKVKRGLERWWENVEALRRESEDKGGDAEQEVEEVQEPSRPRYVTTPCCLDVADRCG
jgi:hypothetical protein